MALRLSLCFLISLFTLTSLASGYPQNNSRLYKHVDKNGHVRFTDRPTHDGYIEMELTLKGWKTQETYANYKANRAKYRPLIARVSEQHGLPHWLIAAVIHAESLYNPQAVSSAGAVGLMQLMPGTALRYGVINRQNPEQNVDAGVRYLNDLLRMFDNNLDLALAAYNAGEQAVRKYGNRIPPYEETRHYVQRVKTLSAKYKSQMI